MNLVIIIKKKKYRIIINRKHIDRTYDDDVRCDLFKALRCCSFCLVYFYVYVWQWTIKQEKKERRIKSRNNSYCLFSKNKTNYNHKSDYFMRYVLCMHIYASTHKYTCIFGWKKYLKFAKVVISPCISFFIPFAFF